MKRTLWMLVFVMVMARAGWAGYVTPDADKLAAAARDSARVAHVLVNANAEQAANTIRLIVERIVDSKLPAETKLERIRAVVRAAFAAFGGTSSALANALGTTVARASFSPVVVSSIQQTVIVVAGAADGVAFGNAYASVMGLSAPVTVGPKSDKESVSMPPVGSYYQGQALD